MKLYHSLSITLVLALSTVKSQVTFPTNGAPYKPHTLIALTNANIYSDYETFISKGTLLFQDGIVMQVGEKIEIPKHALVIDLKGKTIYPSFIDLYSDYGLPEQKNERQPRNGPQMESNVKGAYGWNQAIKSQVEAYKLIAHQPEKAEELKKIGFGVVLSSSKDGIVRGTGALIALSQKKENDCMIKDKAAAFYSFNKGSSTQDYPSSLTGAIALLRQTYYDAIWYNQTKAQTEFNIHLDEFNKIQSLPSIFESSDKFNVGRIAKIGKEFNVSYIIKGSGNEYQRINDVQQTKLKFILPLNFPDVYDVEDPLDAEAVSLTELKHWELAPGNAAAFEKNFIPFCFTTADLKNKEQFLKNLRKAVEYGLSEKTALKALTHNPALFVNEQDKLGALKKGYQANFFVCSGSILMKALKSCNTG